jgi:hypothetical protein
LYPDWALAHKRYALPFIQERCAAYLEDPACTYRTGVEQSGMAMMYADADSGMQLWPSTLWRWVGTLGGFEAATRHALHLIKQKAPCSGLFRVLGALRIGAHKYRSVARRQLLEGCLSFLIVSRFYLHIFKFRLFFPELATGVGFR